MVDIHSILATHHSKNRSKKIIKISGKDSKNAPTVSEIPDLFFDQILVEFKLNRVEILVMMYLYRQVWCRPNLYKEYGLSQILSHNEMANSLKISIDEIYHAIRKIEESGFVETVRSGQYFVRKFFTKENDLHYGQNYDNF